MMQWLRNALGGKRHEYHLSAQKNYKGEWYWHAQAGNGEILAHSETYSSHTKCVESAVRFCHAKLVFVGEKPNPSTSKAHKEN